MVKFAVMGGGNGAHATVADLSMAGYTVNMYELPRFGGNIRPVMERGGIDVVARDPLGRDLTLPSGGGSGFAKIMGKVTTDIKEAMEGVDVIIVVVPAFGHRAFAEVCAPHLEDGQVVVLQPGKVFGALEFASVLREKGSRKKVVVAETSTLEYFVRLTGPAQIRVTGVKNVLPFAAFPAADTGRVLDVLKGVYPLAPARNIFEIDLNILATLIHPVPVLLNVVKIEQLGAYRYSHYDVTPSVARVMEAIDRERMAVAMALGVEPVSFVEWLHRYYGAKGDSIYEVLVDCHVYKSHTSPDSVRHRYVAEDVPCCMVPVSSMGDALEVPTPALKTMISLANLLNETDYWREGRTLDRVGLAGKSASEMLRFVEQG